jgi:hypothetical protein
MPDVQIAVHGAVNLDANQKIQHAEINLLEDSVK